MHLSDGSQRIFFFKTKAKVYYEMIEQGKKRKTQNSIERRPKPINKV